MANWKHRINIKNEWAATDAGTMQIHELAHVIASKIYALSLDDSEVEEIAMDFDGMDETTDVEEFDMVLERLYDWGDITLDNKWPQTKMCWIATTF